MSSDISSEPLRRQLGGEPGGAGDVAARPVEARDQSVLDRIAAGLEHDRNGRGRRPWPRGRGRSFASRRSRRPAGGQARRPAPVADRSGARPSGIRSRRSALDVAGFGEPRWNAGQFAVHAGRRAAVEEADHRHRRLRACYEWPENDAGASRAADQRKEFAPFGGSPSLELSTDWCQPRSQSLTQRG